MQRQEAIEGIEFGLHDFMPWRRGIASPSRPAPRSNRRNLVLAIVFAFLGLLIVLFFSGRDRHARPAVRATQEMSHVSRQDNAWEDDVLRRLDSIIQKFESMEE